MFYMIICEKVSGTQKVTRKCYLMIVIGVSRSFKRGFLQIADEGTKDPFACSLFNELNSYSRVLLLAWHGGSVGNLYTNLDSWSFRVWILFFLLGRRVYLFFVLLLLFVCSF